MQLLNENNVISLEFFVPDIKKNTELFLKIFLNNFIFFLFISLTPIVNIIFFSIQFYRLGIYIYQIHNLSFEFGFNNLYRHTIFEVISIFISVYISYQIYDMSKSFLNDALIDKYKYKKTIKKVFMMYLLIFICTLIGALLEGKFNV